MVTPADILEAIAGAFRSDADAEETAAVPRDDGSWLLAGWMSADEMADRLGITLPPRREYQTVAGFVLAHLRHLPAPGEHVEVRTFRIGQRPNAGWPCWRRTRGPRMMSPVEGCAREQQGVIRGLLGRLSQRAPCGRCMGTHCRTGERRSQSSQMQSPRERRHGKARRLPPLKSRHPQASPSSVLMGAFGGNWT